MAINADVSVPWYRSLNRSQWNTLFATNLGWLFDGYELYALILTIGVALHQLLEPSQYARIPAYAGFIIATTLLGWGIGGMIGGILADYIGRKRTMMLAILAYSLMTGLSAIAWSWESFAVLRFIVGVAIHVSHRRDSRPGHAVERARHSGIRSLGAHRPAPQGSGRAQEGRRQARCRGPCVDALHLDRTVRRSAGAAAPGGDVPDVAVDDACVVGDRELRAALCRVGSRQGRPAGPGLGGIHGHGL